MSGRQETPIDIVSLIAELEKAKAALQGAELRESVARNDTCSARNQINKIQGQIDAWYKSEREKAPYDSDWARSKFRFEDMEIVIKP